jgi:hypothetical protein
MDTPTVTQKSHLSDEERKKYTPKKFLGKKFTAKPDPTSALYLAKIAELQAEVAYLRSVIKRLA